MDVTGIAKLATSIADTGLRQDVSMTMLKKAQDIQSTTATQLLAALPQVTPAQNLPSHLGNHINTTA
jgi:ethanolamine ammonia-lyase small subunit